MAVVSGLHRMIFFFFIFLHTVKEFLLDLLTASKIVHLQPKAVEDKLLAMSYAYLNAYLKATNRRTAYCKITQNLQHSYKYLVKYVVNKTDLFIFNVTLPTYMNIAL